MTEPQVWTLIEVLAASMFGVIAIITGTFTRVLRSEMNTRFDAVNQRMDGLDRDIQGVTEPLWRLDKGA